MNLSERYKDIAKRSNFSEKIVRDVMSALRESIIESLINEERATIPGLVTMQQKPRYRADYLTNEVIVIPRIKASALPSLDDELGRLYKERDLVPTSGLKQYDDSTISSLL